MANTLDGQISRRDFLIMAAGLTATTTLLNSCGPLTRWISGDYATEEGRQIWGTETPTPPATATNTATNTSTATMEPTATPTETLVPTGREIAEAMIRIQPKDLADFKSRADGGELVVFPHPTDKKFNESVVQAASGLLDMDKGPNLEMSQTGHTNRTIVTSTGPRKGDNFGVVKPPIPVGCYPSRDGTMKSVIVFDSRVGMTTGSTLRMMDFALATEDGDTGADPFDIVATGKKIVSYDGPDTESQAPSSEHKSLLGQGVKLGDVVGRFEKRGEGVLVRRGPVNLNWT